MLPPLQLARCICRTRTRTRSVGAAAERMTGIHARCAQLRCGTSLMLGRHLRHFRNAWHSQGTGYTKLPYHLFYHGKFAIFLHGYECHVASILARGHHVELKIHHNLFHSEGCTSKSKMTNFYQKKQT
jgi:hypothetical protein